MSDPIEEFSAAVETEFGAPWSTERTVDGFVARYPLGHVVGEDVSARDEVHLRVVVDPVAKTFGFTTRRIAASDLDRERHGWGIGGYHYSRDVDAKRYTGLRRTMSFRRTPEGLVPAPESPADSAGREADLRAVAARLGYTEEGGRANLAVTLPPTQQLVLIGVIIGVVLLVVVGVAVVVVSQVAAAFLR